MLSAFEENHPPSICKSRIVYHQQQLVCLQESSFLSNIPWVQRWSVTRLLASVSCRISSPPPSSCPHLRWIAGPSLPGSNSLTGRVFWLKWLLSFLLSICQILPTFFSTFLLLGSLFLVLTAFFSFHICQDRGNLLYLCLAWFTNQS